MFRSFKCFSSVVLLVFTNPIAAAPIHPSAAIDEAIERTLQKVAADSWTFRPNNLYRYGRYRSGSAVCGAFPGTGVGSEQLRTACSVKVDAVVDTCEAGEGVVDTVTYRVLFDAEGDLVFAVHDGGENSTSLACDRG